MSFRFRLEAMVTVSDEYDMSALIVSFNGVDDFMDYMNNPVGYEHVQYRDNSLNQDMYRYSPNFWEFDSIYVVDFNTVTPVCVVEDIVKSGLTDDDLIELVRNTLLNA